jgi:hypothetical protein
MNATFQIDLDNATEVTQLKELLEHRLSQIQKKKADFNPKKGGEENENLERDVYTSENEDMVVGSNNLYTGPSLSNTTDNMRILRKFVSQASPNQKDVLEWMKNHPGPVSAHILKQELPFLAPHGALSGVFRPGRWVKLSGGTKDGFPFFQIEWNHEKGCGIYRGLTQEEADYIQSRNDRRNSTVQGGE